MLCMKGCRSLGAEKVTHRGSPRVNRPWMERYEPISYNWHTRSGTPSEFREMVKRCNNVGVRIYVDAVINHMTSDSNVAIGTGGSTANTFLRNYPSVPYTSEDFHSYCEITENSDAMDMRNCELMGNHDLNQTIEYVREKIVNIMNEMIDAGVAGFRLDAISCMWPSDLEVIYSRLRNLSTAHGFPENVPPYILQHFFKYGTGNVSKYEYTKLGVITEVEYGYELSITMRGVHPLKSLKNLVEAWGLAPSEDALVFIDYTYTQRNAGDTVLNFKTPKLYKMAVAFMLAHPYGTPRVMSSFDFLEPNQGPPSDSAENILSPIIYDDNTCGNGWICEHRWRQIYNMVRFRIAVNDTELNNWWDNGNNQIAFCRGNIGFIAINGEGKDLKRTFDSCLPPGVYCDVISGNLVDGKCTGKVVTVDDKNKAYIEILSSEVDGVLAIHQGAKST